MICEMSGNLTLQIVFKCFLYSWKLVCLGQMKDTEFF
jgi:hypothetical protein